MRFHTSAPPGGSEDVGASGALACDRRGSQACQLPLSDKLKLNQGRNHLSPDNMRPLSLRPLRSLKSVLYWRGGAEIRAQSLRNWVFCELETVKHQLYLLSHWSSTGEASRMVTFSSSGCTRPVSACNIVRIQLIFSRSGPCVSGELAHLNVRRENSAKIQ